jgi:hypothetical protein
MKMSVLSDAISKGRFGIALELLDIKGIEHKGCHILHVLGLSG